MKKDKKIFDGRLLKVFVKRVKLPNGFKARIEWIKHPGAVLVIPVFDDGRILFIRQFRPVIGKYIWELPAGTLEKNESLAACAKREIIEETGYSAGELKKIGIIYPVPGYSTEKIIIYKAAKLTKTVKNTMPDEVITVRIFSRSQAIRLLKSGKIIDAKTICALSFLSF